MEDSGNSCGSSVVSDLSGPSDHTDFDGDGVQVSDLEGDAESHILQVGKNFLLSVWSRAVGAHMRTSGRDGLRSWDRENSTCRCGIDTL